MRIVEPNVESSVTKRAEEYRLTIVRTSGCLVQRVREISFRDIVLFFVLETEIPTSHSCGFEVT